MAARPEEIGGSSERWRRPGALRGFQQGAWGCCALPRVFDERKIRVKFP